MYFQLLLGPNFEPIGMALTIAKYRKAKFSRRNIDLLIEFNVQYFINFK